MLLPLTSDPEEAIASITSEEQAEEMMARKNEYYRSEDECLGAIARAATAR